MTPTILIFLKAPELGRVKTRLALDIGDEAALDAYCRLVMRQMTAFPPGWPVEVHFTPAEAEATMKRWLGEGPGRAFVAQREGDLGARLAHAVEGAFDRGASRVVLIGGDCAELGAHEFAETESALDSHDAVLGPSRDGGYYLLALNRRRTDVFDRISWSTGVVAEQTRERLRMAGSDWKELWVMSDVDTLPDWRQVENRV